ncbi:hypothetical protein D4764_06G0011740 [Takifugu flavidus]|uniref:Uncharacterized protein n=1 Tax=Takifugu flavidus TaxID=433684 RepID=A0A5C6MWH2_9TELE|nr:hypothetical protein D4764_06G0011740 [Takifugu flavidus]
MQQLGGRATYIEPSLEFPAAFSSNWDFGDTDTGLTLLPVHKDSQAVIGRQRPLILCLFTRMKTFIITVCLIGALLANPISYDSTASETTEEDSDLVLSVSVSQSAENDTTELQSPETSSESSESVESTSEDNTSEESDSESDENSNSMGETRDDSMGSEENVRKNLIEVIPDNLEESTEAPTVETTTAETTSDSSESTSETSETSESSESNETGRINIADCVNATESCESDEYFFQGIGDNGLYAVDNLMAPDDGERELQLRR